MAGRLARCGSAQFTRSFWLCFFYSAILTDSTPFATRQLEDLIDRVTQHECTNQEMMLAVPPESLHASKHIVAVGETEFVERINVFKWRDLLQFMAIKILLSDKGGYQWKKWALDPEGRYMLSSFCFTRAFRRTFLGNVTSGTR